jgi:hypothetical protein
VSFIEEHAGELILLVIGVAASLVLIFVVVYPAFLKNYNVWANLWGNLGGPPMQATTDFENAMTCAYYRCVKGCDSNEVKSLTATWSDPQTHNDVSCADFCTAGQTICGEDSKNNPVRVDIGEKAYLATDKLSSIVGDKNCIFSTDSETNFLPHGHAGELISTVIEITSNSAVDPDNVNSGVCSYGYVANSKTYSSLNLLPGKYQIYVVHQTVGLIGLSYNHIFINLYQKTSTSTTTTTSIQPITCASQLGTCQSVITCPAGHDLGSLDCPQTVQGAGRTCCK